MGNEISKALEEDIASSVQGVVAEQLVGSQADGNLADVIARQSAKSAANRQQIFSFCADWDLQRLVDFLRWYVRFHGGTDADSRVKRLDLRGLRAQVDTLEQSIATKQSLLQHVEDELHALDEVSIVDASQASERELVQATLETRRVQIAAEIRDEQREVQERKVHLLASIEGVDLTLEVKWRVFIKAVSRVQVHTTLQQQATEFGTWHPAAAGYTMTKHSDAKSDVTEYAKGDILLPPPASHEIDGHTDDSASSSAASGDNGSEGDQEDEADGDGDEAGGEGVDVDDGAVMEGGTPAGDKQRGDEDEEEEDGDDDDDASDKNQTVPPVVSSTQDGADATTQPLTSESLAKHTEHESQAAEGTRDSRVRYQEQLKRPRVVKRPVPTTYDAMTRSPIFFGYSLEKRTNELDDAVAEDEAVVAKENAIFDQKIQQKRAALDETLKAERGKLDVIKQREAELKTKRERYWEKRIAELERAKKELDPNDIFFRTREVQDKKTRDAQAFEDEEMRRQHDKIQARMDDAQTEYDDGVDQIRRVRATNVPLGELRLKFHEVETDRYLIEMQQAKAELATTKEEYVALKKSTGIKIGTAETKNRAQLLYAEDQIRAKEKSLEVVCARYESELFLVKRAQEIFGREQLFLPFFSCLQQAPRPGETGATFSLLEMTAALLLGLGNVDLRAKIAFLFKMFCRPATTNRQSAAARINLIHREAFTEVMRLCLSLLSKLSDFRPRQPLTHEYLLGLADREFLVLDLVIDTQDVSSSRNGMTNVEFERYWTQLISRSRYLSELLGVPWKFDQLSRFVVQHMSAVHQYKLGLMNVNDLKYAIARQAITVRPELSRWQKDVIHERALAMGENDPLKTDYSKYLPKRRTKLLSKVVPLDHGGFRNLLHYRMEVILRATVKLQTTWRARKGRQQARLAAEKQAFYHARGMALQEARERVEAEWREKDDKPAHTVEKMKFEAKIRMKQVKLRTKGHAYSREQVLALLTEEAVQQAQKEAENRFREMEEELGYLNHSEALMKPHDDVEYLKQDISKAIVTEVVQAKQEATDVGTMMDSIALAKELEAKKKQTKNTQPSCNNQETNSAPTSDVGATGQDDQHFANAEDQEKRLAKTQLRQDRMWFGRFPADLYTSGMTRDERLCEQSLASPNPSLLELQRRLKHVCVGMTDFKLTELLQELPSKRHICTYTWSFRRSDGSYDMERLETDLLDHFRIVRGAAELAQALVNIVEMDLEFGRTRRLMKAFEEANERVLRQLVGEESGQLAEQNAAATAKKLVRMGYKTPGTESEEAATEGNPMMLLMQKETHDLTEKKKRVHDAHTRFLEAMRLWREAELSLQESHRTQLKVKPLYPVLPMHRTKWGERLSYAMRLPEHEPLQLRDKYTEVLNVCQDFIDTSRAIARVLVRELLLPVALKSILPVRETPIDGRQDDVRAIHRLKFEAHEIRFEICTDDHGRFENSHENAAKYAGNKVRNSALYHRVVSSRSVLLPLHCVVDFQGFRVLCTSKLPIETVVWNEAGTSIQRVVKQLVYGSDNSGKTIVFQSKELDAILAEAAAKLNLSRHGVRGYQDLTAKMLHAPADLLGYVTSDKRLAIVNFARAMPPEDPEITLHLNPSTRGMSILWRQLRPELVSSFHTPLSPDALSAMTYCTPDWQTQALAVEEATQHLLAVVIPAFARKMSQKREYFTAPGFNLTEEMHRHGINVRHLGLLRAQFLHKLSGTATLQYSTAEIQTTEDFTREVERGAPVYINGSAYTVSRSLKHRYGAQCITLDQVHTGDSIQNVVVYGGRADCAQRAAAIRSLLLAEMTARAFKNLVRHWLRCASTTNATGFTPTLYRKLLIDSLNLFTGSARPSDNEFWTVHLYEASKLRFGPRAVSEVDQQNLRRMLLPKFHYIVQRFCEMMGIRLRGASLERLQQFPDCYVFVMDDLEPDADGVVYEGPCRVKHNLAMLHFSMASLLLLQATVTQATTYKQLILGDTPHGYWPLCERRGISTASNIGIYGKQLVGRYLAGCVLEADGPITNIDLNRATTFRKENRSYIVFPFVEKLYPASPSTHVAVEVWCKCDGRSSTRRVVLTLGRFTLSALKANVWAFSFNIKNIDIAACGASVEPHKWTHLVGTYDGTMLRLYVDGFLQNEVDVESVVDLELAKREAVIAKTRQDIAEKEEEARGQCFKQVDREMQALFAKKEGKKLIKTQSQKLLDEHEFRQRLSKAATATANANGDKATQPAATKRDLSKVSRQDFEPLAKKQLIREKFESSVVAVLAEFMEMRQRVNAKIAQELAEQTDLDARELRIGCLSSASRRDGKYFFHGSIAHVAYYHGKSLTRDQVNAHYFVGVRDRAHTSDDLFALASSRFARALAFAPDDQRTLERFAENICASLKYDLDHQHAQEMYKKKVRCGLAPFVATENAHGIAEVLKNLPREPAFSDLFVECYHSVLAIQPAYFQAVESINCRLALRELGRMPFAFFLGSKSANSLVNMHNVERENEEVEVFADIVKKVLLEYPTFYGDQLTHMEWLRSLQTPRAVVYFILLIESSEDVRVIDFKDVSDLENGDLEVIATNNRFALSLGLAHCGRLEDPSIVRVSLCCAQLEHLDLSYCSKLTDVALAAIGKHCTRLMRLWLVHCHLITDLGVEAAVRSNTRLEELSLSYCERVSERSMATIGSSSASLAVLELELCVQINSAALKHLAASLVNPSKLRRLNLAGCHRVADDGLLEVAKTCPKLQHVNVRLCDKLTDASLRVLTHNNLELAEFNLEEVTHATFKLFQFDQEHDGRGVVDKNLAKQLRTLNLSACTGMNDLALGHVGHRAKRLETISLSSCTEITDHGLVWLLVEDMLDKSPCGQSLVALDVSYCPQLSASGLHDVVRQCTSLVSLNLSGCIHLSDADLIDIIDACSKLVKLQVAFCRELTDAVLLSIAKHLALEVLNVSRCFKITDDGVREVLGQLTGLKNFNVTACKRLTDATLYALLEGCGLLEELEVTHCPHFSSDMLARFRQRRVKVVTGKVNELVPVEATGGDSKNNVDEDDHVQAREEAEKQRVSEMLADAKKATRKARLPGSDTSLPPIDQRKGDQRSNSNSVPAVNNNSNNGSKARVHQR